MGAVLVSRTQEDGPRQLQFKEFLLVDCFPLVHLSEGGYISVGIVLFKGFVDPWIDTYNLICHLF